MMLANLGAEVIKVEGHKRMDIVRRAVMWPRWEPEPHQVPPEPGVELQFRQSGQEEPYPRPEQAGRHPTGQEAGGHERYRHR